jgi:hypothetical protein
LTPNNRVIITKDFSRIYSLTNSTEISGRELATGKKVSSTKILQGKPYNIHFTPDGKFIVVATDTTWYLLDPNQNEPKLAIPLFHGNELDAMNQKGRHKGNPLVDTTSYYSPDGNLLIISSHGSFYFVDCQECKLIGKVWANIQKGKIIWLP